MRFNKRGWSKVTLLPGGRGSAALVAKHDGKCSNVESLHVVLCEGGGAPRGGE